MEDIQPDTSLQPKPIRKLDASTVNRIAAGEIIQRPANALKELLENALDAGSTRIIITAKEGGLKLLTVQDNGSGIRKEDLPRLCERFTTSKITKFEDLHTTLNTFGFRGEALASISHVSHLTVTTKTRDASCAYKAAYSDGQLVPIKQGYDAEPRPAAGSDGTLLSVDDMFFNVPSRRKALHSGADEYNRIVDVVSKYAIHNAGIAISCKKAGSNSPDVSTVAGATVNDNIGLIYNTALKRELVPVELPHNPEFGFSFKAYASTINYVSKKSTYLFFINNRLVECAPLRKALDAFYTTLLPKGGRPFVYCSLVLNPEKIDVNVHPTKSEVYFMDQDEIVQRIIEAIGAKLAETGSSRKFEQAKTQTTLEFGSTDNRTKGSQAQTQTHKAPPQKLVRTDASARTLDAMFGYQQPEQRQRRTASTSTYSRREREVRPMDRSYNDVVDDREEDTGASSEEATVTQSKSRPKTVARNKVSNCKLTSVLELRAAVEAVAHQALTQVFRNHTFVGLVGPDQPRSLIQHETRLYLVQHDVVAEELFYQLGLRQFGEMERARLVPPPSVATLVRLAIQDSKGLEASGLSVDGMVEHITGLWIAKADMLLEYFGIEISPLGHLVTLPSLLDGYTPVLDRLPHFLVRAALEVDWQDEKGCFDTFLRELAFFHRPCALHRSKTQNTDEQQWQIQHVVFPAVQRHLVAPPSLAQNGHVQQIASLEKLYRVFERC